MNMSPSTYEYRTTFATVPSDFPNHETVAKDLAKISPKPPNGENWRLASSTATQTNSGVVVLYFWERQAR